MRLQLPPLIFACGILLYAALAHADIDHRCLGDCISGGKSSSACMPECSYGKSSAQPQSISGVTAETSHKVLDAPIPSSELILDSPLPIKSAPGRDYTCINQCLQGHWQYQLCEKRCMKGGCGTGPTQCKNLTGTAAGPVSSP